MRSGCGGIGDGVEGACLDKYKGARSFRSFGERIRSVSSPRVVDPAPGRRVDPLETYRSAATEMRVLFIVKSDRIRGGDRPVRRAGRGVRQTPLFSVDSAVKPVDFLLFYAAGLCYSCVQRTMLRSSDGSRQEGSGFLS